MLFPGFSANSILGKQTVGKQNSVQENAHDEWERRYQYSMNTLWQDFLTPLQNTLHNIVSFVPRMLVALTLFALFFALATVVRRVARRSLEQVKHIPWAVRLLIARSIYFVTIFIGILVALSAVNVNVTTLIASLGVAGFALGFALKDILENFIAGILLLFARPFEMQDQVTVDGHEGTVVDIQIRTTSLRTYSGEIVLIPNSKVFTNAVINHTRLGKRRYSVAFDTSLEADSNLVFREALQAVQSNPDVATDPAPFVRMRSVDSGNDVLSWQVYYWADPSKATEIETISSVLGHIKRNLYDAGVPTPTSTSATILRRPPPAASGMGLEAGSEGGGG
jgi:small conductance mechanosensitive channel